MDKLLNQMESCFTNKADEFINNAVSTKIIAKTFMPTEGKLHDITEIVKNVVNLVETFQNHKPSTEKLHIACTILPHTLDLFGLPCPDENTLVSLVNNTVAVYNEGVSTISGIFTHKPPSDPPQDVQDPSSLHTVSIP